MSGNVLEFFIKLTDLTGRAIASATANVNLCDVCHLQVVRNFWVEQVSWCRG